MSKCACIGTSCQCVEQSTDTIEASGAGTAAVPYQHDVIPTGVAPLLISTDVPNHLSIGTDGLLKTSGGLRNLYSSGVAVTEIAPGPTTLASFTVPGGTLAANGDRLRWRASFLFEAFGFDVFSLTIKYGGSVLISKPATSTFDGTGIFEGEIIRTAAADQRHSTTGLLSFPGGNFGEFVTQIDAAGRSILLGLNNAANHNFEVISQSAHGPQVTLDTLTIDYFPH